MTLAEKKKLYDMIQAMSQEEQQVVAAALPIAICYNQIGKQLQKDMKLHVSLYDVVEKMNSVDILEQKIEPTDMKSILDKVLPKEETDNDESESTE